MWTPYSCIIWPCPYNKIQWCIPHNRLKRLDFSFGHSIFSLLMVHSKGGGSLSILILSSGMKATTKFLALESKAIFGCFLPFSKICFSGLLWCSDRGGGLRNIICQNSWKTNKFFSSFLTLFSDFSWTWKSISQQKLLEKGLFRNTLVFFYVWFCVQGGGEGGTGGTLMKLSFDKAL